MHPAWVRLLVVGVDVGDVVVRMMVVVVDVDVLDLWPNVLVNMLLHSTVVGVLVDRVKVEGVVGIVRRGVAFAVWCLSCWLGFRPCRFLRILGLIPHDREG